MKDCVSCVHEYLSPMSDTCRECGIAMLNYEEAKPKPITNYDCIVRKSPEELAEWIAEILFHCSNTICDKKCPMYKCCCDQPSDNIEDWLKQEAE